jgi:hypothetical protein
MNYAVEMGLDALIYIYTKFHSHSKANKGDTHRQHAGIIFLLLFFQNKESGLKRVSF